MRNRRSTLESFLPRAGLAELTAELLEKHFGEPVLTGVEDREDPVLERP